MIPRKLQLKNFLSYGDTLQTIDFSSHSLICFSGKNGHGKSALLDAITWALWGQARKVSGASKPDEGLLRLGQSKMLVSFEFELTGRVFRVRREFFKTYSRPITALDLEVHDLGSDKFVSLTEKTMRQTQAKLEDLLKIDFSTFSNSSFLRQGSADEFSKKTPRERKQVLAKILGIDRFDQYHQTAMEQVRSLQQEGATMQALRERIADEVEKQPELEIKLGEYLAKLDELGLQGQVAEKNVWLLERKKNKFDVVLQEITLVSSERDELKTRFIECAGQWRRHHVQILSIPCGKSLERELKKVAAKDAELRKKQTLKNELDRKAIDIEKAEQQRLLTFRQELDVKLNQQRQDLEKERTHVATFSSQFEAICAESTRIAQRIEALEKQVADGAKDEAEGKKLGLELVEVRAQFEKRRSFYQVLVQKGNWFSKLKSELDHKQGAVCRDNNPCCPLCEQMLSAKRKRFLGAQVANELNHCKHCLERIKHLIPRLKKILFDQHESLNLLQKKVAQYEQKAGRLVEVANECQRLLQEQKMCETKKKKAEALFNQEEEKVKNSEKYLVVLLKHVQKAI
ncbi:SMC family ATPase, partial [Candidatus Babeliales bacterium]|nr:SMC family ATPase [Candidatus Babeliales bacterium]